MLGFLTFGVRNRLREGDEEELKESRKAGKSPNYKSFIKSEEFVRLERKYTGKEFNYTKAGIRDLASAAHKLFETDKKALKWMDTTLGNLSGKGTLAKLLDGLKNAFGGSEGIIKTPRTRGKTKKA
ncbi:hypothetical protein JXB01_02080 [Candidatus Micrarchaeota archaeon]|nr:hypothetical protein [Candidatus Micrarchaeota archaeon]